jgi:glycosyltransferase involved in cell wall biosynthesis
MLRAVDFLILPSVTTKRFKEPWGLVINEAMNANLPVIVTDAVGAAAGGLVIHRKTGLVVPERDAVSLANAMDSMASDPELRRGLASRAQEHVLRWSFEAGVDAILEAVNAATGRGSDPVASPPRP